MIVVSNKQEYFEKIATKPEFDELVEIISILRIVADKELLSSSFTEKILEWCHYLHIRYEDWCYARMYIDYVEDVVKENPKSLDKILYEDEFALSELL